jgi:phosphomannomutase
VGIGLFLTHLVTSGMTCSSLRRQYPDFSMVKDKLQLPPVDVDAALDGLKHAFPEAEVNDIDGVKFDLEEGWVHLRKSNTEPIIRIYSEASTPEEAEELANRFKHALQKELDSAPMNA